MIHGSEQKRIAILSLKDHEYSDPQPVYLAATLADDGHNVTFIAPLSQQAMEYLRSLNVSAVKIAHRLPTKQHASRSLFARARFLLQYIITYAIYCIQLVFVMPQSVDVIIGTDRYADRVVWLFRHLWPGARHIVYLLELYEHYLENRGWFKLVDRRMWGHAEMIILPNSARCEWFERQLPFLVGRTRSLLNCPLSTWPNHIPRPITERPWPLTLSYIGSISPSTGLHFLLESIAECRRPVRLLLAGIIRDYQYMSRLEDYVESRELQDRILLLGRLPRAEIPDIIERAHVSVAFYPWRSPKTDVNFKLCAPNKIYESLALGRPVIASDNPSLAFIAEEQLGWLVDIEHPSALRSLLEELADDPMAVQDVAQRARRRFLDDMNFEACSLNIREAISRM